MTIDWIWLLFALPGAFALGWLFSRLDIRQLRLEAQHQPKAYFRGLNHLLNGQQDHAIDSFIEAIQNDPDTSELHFTLGNLFRRRGEYDRAVRIHEHLLSRADLTKEDRNRAQLALAQDYVSAGLLDRAEATLTTEEQKNNVTAQRLLLAVYERARDWQGAFRTAMQLQAQGHGSYQKQAAHYLCEQQQFDEAIRLAPASPRAYLERSKQQMAQQDYAKSYALLLELAQNIPQCLPLFANDWLTCAQTPEEQTTVITQLEQAYENMPSIDILNALITARQINPQESYSLHLKRTGSLLAACKLITQADIQTDLQRAVEPLQRYRCAACGFEAKQYFWQCPGCQSWDSYPFRRVEEL